VAEEVERTPTPRFRQDWVFLYYMPYDNDLGVHAEAVMQRIQSGTVGGVEAAVMADLPGPGGMTFVTFADGIARPYSDPTQEDSADPASLARFLEQAAAIYEARRYAVVILDHGGSLDQLARDEHPTTRWLPLRDTAAAISRFRAFEPGEVELVFLQVCTRAALSQLYELRDAGRYTMASQLLLGAPNDYYIPVLRGITPEMSGPDVVAAIAGAEGSQMHLSYTCIDNRALADLPAVMASVDLSGLTAADLASTLFSYDADRFADAGAVLAAAGAEEARSWLTGTLRCGYYPSTDPSPHLLDRQPDTAGLSGISLYIPPPEGAPARYRSLALYGEVGWLDALVGVP
jgi:hypothetical protein